MALAATQIGGHFSRPWDLPGRACTRYFQPPRAKAMDKGRSQLRFPFGLNSTLSSKASKSEQVPFSKAKHCGKQCPLALRWHAPDTSLLAPQVGPRPSAGRGIQGGTAQGRPRHQHTLALRGRAEAQEAGLFLSCPQGFEVHLPQPCGPSSLSEASPFEPGATGS